MTAPTPCADQSEQTLIALALVESLIEENAINRNDIFNTTTWGDLLVGMTALAKTLILSLAAGTGQTSEQMIDKTRDLFLHYGNPRSGS